VSDIVMPRLSDTMEEGTILRWLKQDGEQVKRGEELVEIETDKANMTYESDRDGVLHTVAREGDTLAVGQPIAQIAAEGEAPAEREAPAPAAAPAAPHGNGTPPEGAQAQGVRVKASPLARRIARQAGVDLRSLSGSGPGGRIVKADVEAAHLHGPAAHAPEPAAHPREPAAHPREPGAPGQAPAPVADGVMAARGQATVVEPTRTQRTIARRMAESKATIPDFTLQMDVDMERCVALRRELKRLSHDDAPTYNDMLVKACGLALREHPRANASYRDGVFELHSRVNVGVAVAASAEDPLRSALVVPTVLDADRKALGEIARETRTLAQKVRDGSITPPELSGATFTVSNLGMYGVSSFTAIVNPPQAAILAVGAVRRRAVVADERSDGPASGRATEGADAQIAARHTMTLTLSCDHRILYGADAALFLARIRELLEEPAALTL
jgi:pyruvate dehydrogenase E2 component (dihydrolipoamide acetyltransferase)